MLAVVLRVIALVLSVPCGMLSLVGLAHLPVPGSDDPSGTTRKCLLAGGALAIVSLAFSLLGELAVLVSGSSPTGALGPLAYLVLDVALAVDTWHMLVDLGSLSASSDARRRSLVLVSLAALSGITEMAAGTSPAGLVLLVCPSALLVLLGLTSYAFLWRTGRHGERHGASVRGEES